MILDIFMVIVAVVCAFIYKVQQETLKRLEDLRMEIQSEQPPVDLCDDDEHWELFRNEIAAEALLGMMRDEKNQLNEDQMADVCYRYAEALCDKLREQ